MDSVEVNEVKTGIISTIVVLSIIMNCLLITVLVKYAELREDRSALFMLSLSLADLGNGLVFPIGAAVCCSATPTVQHMTQYLNMILNWLFVAVSQHSQAWVALYKMTAVLRPLRYEQLLTKHRCYTIIVCIWVVSAALAASRWILTVTWNMNVCMYILEAGNRIISSYIYVSQVLILVLDSGNFSHLRHRANFPRRRPSSQSSIGSGAVNQRRRQRSRTGDSKGDSLRQKRPHHLLRSCGSYGATLSTHEHASRILRRTHAVTVFSFVAIYLCVCNTFTNSFLYMVLHRTIRQKFKLMFTSMYESCLCD